MGLSIDCGIDISITSEIQYVINDKLIKLILENCSNTNRWWFTKNLYVDISNIDDCVRIGCDYNKSEKLVKFIKKYNLIVKDNWCLLPMMIKNYQLFVGVCNEF